MSHSLLPAALLGALLAGCTAGNSSSCPASKSTIVLPQDEAPHPVSMEWWYYTGHLATTSGDHYGFELTIFQATTGAEIGYVGHYAITDLQQQTHPYFQRVVAVSARAPRFDLSVDDLSIRGEAGSDHLVAAMDGYAIDLLLTPKKPPAIHGNEGVIEMGGGQTSFYYSKTRNQVSGTLTKGDQTLPVTGLGWMDHQWGDFDVFASNGWDWFSVQLDDQVELMLYLLHFKDGHTGLTGGTISTADGCIHALTDPRAQSTGEWTSPHTNATYPMGWTLSSPSEGLDLTIEPLLLDQEMDTRQSTLNVYWEGAVEIQGTHLGKGVAGQGYVELAGYGPWGPGS